MRKRIKAQGGAYVLEAGDYEIKLMSKTAAGYVLDTTPQSILIKDGEAQTLTFYNKSEGGLELIKVSEDDPTQRIPGTTFEIRKMDGALVETVTTGSDGRVHVNLDAGSYYALEIEAADGFKLDATHHDFTVQDGKCTTLTVKNKPFSGILIHKTDSVTGKGLYGVTFLLYDSTNTPIGQYTSDNQGYVYIEGLTDGGRYYLRELENKGYIPDTQMKTVYVKAGETTLIEWKNTPITAQIQITKKSADYNSVNGLPAGTLLEGAVFEIRDKAGNLVDTIRSDSRGMATSKPLPLERYTIKEVKAPANYGVSDQELTAYLEHAGQIVRFEVTNKSLTTGVSITKTGPKQAMAGQPVNYSFLFGRGTLRFARCKLEFPLIRQILYMGVPSFIMEFSIGIVTFVYNSAIVRHGSGELGLAAYLLIGYIMLIVLTLFLGMAEGLQPVFSYFSGTGEQERNRALRRFAMMIFIALGLVCYVLIVLFSKNFYAIFSQNDPELIAFASDKSRTYLCGFFLAGFNILMISYWQSTKQTKQALVISLLRSMVLPPLLVTVLPLLFGGEVIWLCHSFAEALTACAVGMIKKHCGDAPAKASGSA